MVTNEKEWSCTPVTGGQKLSSMMRKNHKEVEISKAILGAAANTLSSPRWDGNSAHTHSNSWKKIYLEVTKPDSSSRSKEFFKPEECWTPFKRMSEHVYPKQHLQGSPTCRVSVSACLDFRSVSKTQTGQIQTSAQSSEENSSSMSIHKSKLWQNLEEP